jgi:predicted dehydrogenase
VRLMATGDLRPSRLTSHTFDLADGASAYELLASDEPSLGIVLRYPGLDSVTERGIIIAKPRRRPRGVPAGGPRIAMVGAGGFAKGTLIPELVKLAPLTAVATATGVSARGTATRFGATRATTDPDEVFAADDVDAVAIATRHDTHADYTARALAAGKHVFVEKPPAIDREQLALVERATRDNDAVYVVGFNRRFAPLAARMHAAMAGRGPLMITYRVNAGRIPRDHWTHDPAVGGGRIVGEVCHFVDFVTWLCGALPASVTAAAVAGSSEPRDDNVAATLTFPDGSVAVIVYSALGDPGLPKERVEALGEAGAAVLDDFRSLRIHQKGRTSETDGRQDKGHAVELATFVDACRTGTQPWPVSDMLGVMRATFDIRDAVGGASEPAP